MEFLAVIKERYSCRGFKDIPIEEEKIKALLEIAKSAPTAVNYQPQRILVITDKEKINALKTNDCTKCTFDAPLLMVICYDKDVSWKRRFDGKDMGTVDASIVTTYLMLGAVELGLGSTWVAAFDPEIARNVLHIPENYEPVAFLPIGYPMMEAGNRHYERKNTEEFSFRNTFA